MDRIDGEVVSVLGDSSAPEDDDAGECKDWIEGGLGESVEHVSDFVYAAEAIDSDMAD